MRLYTLLLTLLLGSATCMHADQPDGIMHIINNNDEHMNLFCDVPDQTSVLIKFTKLESSQVQEMLHTAILNDSAQEIRRAVYAGADLHTGKEGKSPLWHAVNAGRYPAIKTLLAYDEVNVDEEIMQHAVKMHDIKAAVLLARKGRATLHMNDVGHLLFNAKNAGIAWKTTQKLIKGGYKIASCKLLECTDYLSERAKAYLDKKEALERMRIIK